MRLKEIFVISRGTKVILTITLSVSLAAFTFAFFYYRGINRSEDPRILKARELLIAYDRISGNFNIAEAFPLLDSAYMIFNSLPDYEFSFETGVIYNNKCSTLLLKAMYDTTIADSEINTLLGLSLKYCDSSILSYKMWLEEWGPLSADEIAGKLSIFMKKEDPAFKGRNFEKIFNRRIKNMVMAQTETPRRLSVSFTNKGTIYRHMMKPDSSLLFYREALSLWKDNRTAKSNLSVLTGGDPVKPTIIESLFPPDKNRN